MRCQSSRTAAGSTSFINGELGVLASTLSGATTGYTAEPDGTLTSITSGGAIYYYLYDGEGNVIGLVDISGARQATYSYDPYGNTTASGTDASLNPFRYEGGYEDSTGLYHFGDRYYNAVTGQWTQLDPTGQNPGYAYTGDDPIDNADPTGDGFSNQIYTGPGWKLKLSVSGSGLKVSSLTGTITNTQCGCTGSSRYIITLRYERLYMAQWTLQNWPNQVFQWGPFYLKSGQSSPFNSKGSTIFSQSFPNNTRAVLFITINGGLEGTPYFTIHS